MPGSAYWSIDSLGELILSDINLSLLVGPPKIVGVHKIVILFAFAFPLFGSLDAFLLREVLLRSSISAVAFTLDVYAAAVWLNSLRTRFPLGDGG
mgnify:CR=1 FL=1